MNQHFPIKLVGIDLDGTLLRNDKSVSKNDFASLIGLGESKIIRVAATGRSLHKVKEVLPLSMPIDYVVFSSGGGIYDWKKHRLLQSEHFENHEISRLCNYLIANELNFFIYRSIPHNNKFYYHQGKKRCYEFENYIFRHSGDYQILNKQRFPDDSGQIMVILPNDDLLFESLKTQINEEFSEVKVIRTTSPVDENYLWLEIFPKTVSKGHGLKWLCDYLGISYFATLGIGNDYNDQDMFDFVAHPFVLGNGVALLRQKYATVNETNEESGVTVVINQLKLVDDCNRVNK